MYSIQHGFEIFKGIIFRAHSFEAAGVWDFQPLTFSINFTAMNISSGSIQQISEKIQTLQLVFTSIFISGEGKL